MRNYVNTASDTITTSATVSSSTTVVPVSSGGTFPAADFTIRVDDEVMLVTGLSGASSTNLTVTRGYDGTSASTHASGVGVKHVVVASDFGELLGSTTYSGASTASETFSSLSQIYSTLIIVAELKSADAADQDWVHLRVGNGSVDTGSSYAGYSYYNGSTAGSHGGLAQTSMTGGVDVVGAGDSDSANAVGLSIWRIHGYAETDRYKTVTYQGGKGGGDTYYATFGFWEWQSTSAIDVVQVWCDGGNINEGRIKVYGSWERTT